MADPESSTSQPPLGGGDDASRVRTLYVDSDDDARDAISAISSDRERIELLATGDPAEAESVLRNESIDCLLATGSVLESNEQLLDEAPKTILYTQRDPTEVDVTVLGGVDSLVEKGPAASPHFLMEKTVAVVTEMAEPDSVSTKVVDVLAADVDDGSVFVVDDDGQVVWSNVALEDAVPGDVEDESADFYTRVARQVVETPDAMQDVLSLRGDDTARSTEIRVLDLEETVRQYLHMSYPSGGTLSATRVEILVEVTDVTGRYERLNLFDELVDNAEDGLFVLDHEGRFEYYNTSYAEMLNYDREELLGEHASVTMAEGEIERGQDAVSDHLESSRESTVTDLTLVGKSGETVETAIHFSTRSSEDSYTGLMGVVRDITQRKERERELEKYHRLVESAADPMYVLDEAGSIQILNDSMADFVGREKSAVAGEDIRSFLPDESLEVGQDALRQVLANDDRESASFEVWLRDADDVRRRFEVTVSAIVEAGDYAGAVATFRDITTRHRRAEELDLRKQIFARSLRHNIRNETSIIHSYSSILAEELDGEQAVMARQALEASRKLADTSRKVSQFDRLVEKDKTLVEHDLLPLVERCIEQVRTTTPDADVTVSVPAGTKVVAIRDLSVAIQNLVENAIQHTDDRRPPEVELSASADDSTVTLAVTDDGPGIPPGEVSVIEAGEESDLDHGSGLGLWLVRHVVDKSGGELSFTVDEGTRVEVTLPRPDTSR